MDIIERAPNKIAGLQDIDDLFIIRFLQGKIERTDLTAAAQEQVDNMTQCAELIKQYGSRIRVVPMLTKILHLSERQAYRLYSRTERLFGETSVKNQQFWLDIELGLIEEDIRGARVAKDFKAIASLRKIKADLIKNLMASGDAMLYETIQPPDVVIGFFPQSMKINLPRDKELKVLVSEKLKQIADDIPFEGTKDN